MKARYSIILTAAALAGLGLAASAFGHGFGQGYGPGYGGHMMGGYGPHTGQQVTQRFQNGHHMGWRDARGVDHRGYALRDGTGPREFCPFYEQVKRAQQDTEDAG